MALTGAMALVGLLEPLTRERGLPLEWRVLPVWSLVGLALQWRLSRRRRSEPAQRTV
jgi:hypothetical protein